MSRAVEFHLSQWGLNYFCVPFTGSITITLSVLAVCIVAFTDAASGSCPLPSKIYSCSPKCVQNYDCSHGKVCCPNSCNTKSCVDLATFGGANNGKDKYSQSGGAGVYCNNQKCNSFEVCKLDPATKKMKCMRA
ncbi:waprin-Thr1 isoform X2 [Danaus plexippus]|uniref:waprin-Thr1 isoform X2 n=1 Tax=Danaus plexippus TaxID=13037 RepID=UPI002AB2FA93|nr:waprin-Thr1 isoform X2 [Danaus plexippus]